LISIKLNATKVPQKEGGLIPMSMATQFILADNQEITRAGFSALIAQTFRDTAMVSIVEDHEALQEALTGRNRLYDSVVLLDYELFDFNDVDALLDMVHQHPATHWILCSNDLDEHLILRIGKECSISMILKGCPATELCTVLKCATRHERYLCHQVSNLLLNGNPERAMERRLLSPVETEILRLIAMGKTVKEIAASRNSSIHTIITHKKNIFRKIEVHTTYEATHYAIRSGLIVLDYYI
jgi:DNA-binding NarL/FixJ family response regulator